MEENKISLCSPHSPVRAPSPRKAGCSWDLFQKIADTSAISPSFKFLLVLSQRSSREENPHFVWTLLTRSKRQTQLPYLNPPWKTPKKQQVLTPTSSAWEQLKKKNTQEEQKVFETTSATTSYTCSDRRDCSFWTSACRAVFCSLRTWKEI